MKELASSYDILKVLGHGGFSAVFKARRKTDGHIVALKQLDFSVQNEQQKEYRDFKEEVDILKKLDHPNIVKVYDEYIIDNKPSLEMEFIDGETLETILKREGFISIDDILELIEQIAGALNYCHHYSIVSEMEQQTNPTSIKRNAVIHNDINPKNIIRTTNADGSNRYVVIDFGLSFTDPNAVRHSKKEEGMAEYKSPEKWNGAMVEAASDIYSLGIVIYELLTGAVPFPVKDYKITGEMIQLEEKHKTASIPNLCEKRIDAIKNRESRADVECDIPQWLVSLVEKCLEKNPSKRFETGRELCQFFYDGIEGKIQTPLTQKSDVILLDPELEYSTHRVGAYLEVVPNFITEPQYFALSKEITIIGRWNEFAEKLLADFAIKTGDDYISKSHCQIIRRVRPEGGYSYLLADPFPSKNGTFYNMNHKSKRLDLHIKVNLKQGDFFWIGNTKVVFHEN